MNSSASPNTTANAPLDALNSRLTPLSSVV